jgi:predicted dehydrogenase
MLKIGVLGAGYLGKIHIRLLKESDKFEVVGFHDPDKEVENAVKNEFGIKAFSSVDELINSCEVIDIVTPSAFHFTLAQKALKKTRHIFIERPLTQTLQEAKSLIRLAGEANVKIQVGHVERFNPAFIAAKDLINEPLFIDAQRLSLFNPKSSDVSVVMDLMIHDIDIVLSLVKANIRRISASGFAVMSQTPDIANARIEFDNGAVANLTANRISFINTGKSRFFSRDSYISVDYLNKSASMVRMKNDLTQHFPNSFPTDRDKIGVNENFTFESLKVENTDAIQLELDSFAQSILHDQRPIVSLDDGFKAMDVANKIIEQLRLNANFAAATINA